MTTSRENVLASLGEHGRNDSHDRRERPLAELLEELVAFVRCYVIVRDEQADAIALWVVHTHVIDAFETTPFLAVTSPTKRCGKTRLLDVVELVAAKPWRTIMPSEAVLFRKINAVGPTLLLDETDAIFGNRNGDTEPLRALLNAGNRRGTKVPRCVGPSLQLVDFEIFCPKALVGIGNLPDTITDRSIVIRLQRKRRDEAAKRFRRREALEATDMLLQNLQSWAGAAVDDLERARPDVPDALDDRAEEAWEPLLAIADLAGGSWPARARAAAIALAAPDVSDDEALGTLLLQDIAAVFAEKGVDRISSHDLAEALSAIEESPWGDLRGKELDARGLARRLRPFGVRPKTIRFDEVRRAKGYSLEVLGEALSRYLPGFERDTVTMAQPCGFEAPSEPSHVTDEKGLFPAQPSRCHGVTDKSPSQAGNEVPRPGDEDFLDFIRTRYRAGHLTREEWLGRVRLHRQVALALHGSLDDSAGEGEA